MKMKLIRSITKNILITNLIIFSIMSSFLSLSLNTKSKNFLELTHKSQLDPELALQKFPELVPIAWNTQKNEVDGNLLVESVQKIDKYTEKIKTVTPFDWSEIKVKYAGSNPEKMKKFLSLRIVDLKNSILKALNSRYDVKNADDSKFSPCDGKNFSFKSSNYDKFFKGPFKAFSTDCIIFRRGKNTLLKGKYIFMSGGSQSLTSDIDISVDFKGLEEKDFSVFEKLHAVAVLIKAYNKQFKEIHKQSSLKTFDVNLYSLNFSYDSIIDKLNYLFGPKANPNEKKQFIYANRLSVLMLLYNDGFGKMEEYFKDKSSKDVEESIHILREDFYKNSLEKLVQESSLCGKAFVTNDPNKVVSLDDFKAHRDGDDEKRNTLMMKSISKAGKVTLEKSKETTTTNEDEENPLKFLCHNLAANYYALEAYVPYGSIIDMLSLQGILKIETSRSKDFIINLPKHAMEDSLLMNIAYSIEHYYELMIFSEKANTDFAKNAHKADALSKFSKYVARTFRLSNLVDSASEVQNLKLSYRKVKAAYEKNCIKKNLLAFFKNLGMNDALTLTFSKFNTVSESVVELDKVDKLKKQLLQALKDVQDDQRETLIKNLFMNELKECAAYFQFK